MPRRIHRRRFLQTSAVAGTAALFVNPINTAEAQPNANERIRVGIVGDAGMKCTDA